MPKFGDPNGKLFGVTGKLTDEDLKLRSTTTIDLKDPEMPPTFLAEGTLQPFAVAIGDIMDLYFNKSVFKSDGGGRPDVDVPFNKVELGNALKFLQALQQYLVPKPGGGFYLIVTGTPGIKAGYILDLGTISFGALSFLNVTIGAGIEMP